MSTPAGIFSTVLVGVDGRLEDGDAIALAEFLLAASGELTLAHIEHRGSVWHRSTPADSNERRSSEDLLAHAQARASVPARLHWREATTPGRGLHELADELGADLLVIGSSPRALRRRVMVGDTIRHALDGAELARRARCSLLVLTRGARIRQAQAPALTGATSTAAAAEPIK